MDFLRKSYGAATGFYFTLCITSEKKTKSSTFNNVCNNTERWSSELTWFRLWTYRTSYMTDSENVWTVISQSMALKSCVRISVRKVPGLQSRDFSHHHLQHKLVFLYIRDTNWGLSRIRFLFHVESDFIIAHDVCNGGMLQSYWLKTREQKDFTPVGKVEASQGETSGERVERWREKLHNRSSVSVIRWRWFIGLLSLQTAFILVTGDERYAAQVRNHFSEFSHGAALGYAADVPALKKPNY